jgi:hypothetical protein
MMNREHTERAHVSRAAISMNERMRAAAHRAYRPALAAARRQPPARSTQTPARRPAGLPRDRVRARRAQAMAPLLGRMTGRGDPEP